MRTLNRLISVLLLVLLSHAGAFAKTVHHYVFFNNERERITEESFLQTKAFEGAQLKYMWRELEPEKDQYDFSAIRKDLAFLNSKGKKLFIQLQDVTFSARWYPVPPYLRSEAFNGGVAPQYDNDAAKDGIQGWVARRWDPLVQDRLYKLFAALGREFDGKIEGINLAETAIVFGRPDRIPKGFTHALYRDAVIANMKELKRAFPKSVVIQYANFMPGEWRPVDDKGYLRSVYQAARENGVGVGGPDLMPFRQGQLNSSYPLIKETSGTVPTGVAVQDGNYADPNPANGKRPTIAELLQFATNTLKVDYVFWCTEEPYYTSEVIPFLRKL